MRSLPRDTAVEPRSARFSEVFSSAKAGNRSAPSLDMKRGVTRGTLTALLLIGGLGWGQAAWAQCDDGGNCAWSACRTPAKSVPFSGDLQPATPGQLPESRDTTYWREHVHGFNHNHPHWMSLDIQNGWIFAAARFGLQVWDARTSPDNPNKVANLGPNQFPPKPVWPTDPHEFDPVRWVAAPPGNDNLLAVGLGVSAGSGGVAVFNTQNKANPDWRYGDGNIPVTQVHAARINGRDYAFAAAGGNGLLIYDLTSAAALPTKCHEQTQVTGPQCGVYRGKLAMTNRADYVAGVGNATDTSHWLAVSHGRFNQHGVTLWNVSNPSNPQNLGTVIASERVHGVALWRAGSAYYMAVRMHSPGEARIYNVSCLATNNCSSLGPPLWSAPKPAQSQEFHVTHSRSGGQDYVYFGETNACRTGTLQYEWLYRVTDPANPVDITPAPQVVQGQLTGYWGWYYRRQPTGFNLVRPVMGRFYNEYFYKAGYSIFDIHRLTSGLPPVADFNWSPEQPFAGDPVNFTDASTGSPTSWSWEFLGGSPESSTSQNPSGISWGTPSGAGAPATQPKQVTLVAQNAVGTSDPRSKIVTVVNPWPKVGAVTAMPNPALVCQPVTFEGQNVTGKPPLSYAWEVRDAQAAPVASGSNTTLVWDTTNADPGTYTGELTVSNSENPSGTSSSTSVTIDPLPPLPEAGTFPPSCINCAGSPPSPPSGVAQLEVSAAGATEWRWNCDDGNGWSAWSSDPVSGPKRTCTYSTTGNKTVSVEVRNCLEGARGSQLQINIAQIEPLVAKFKAQGCSAWGCNFDAGQAITFADQSTGGPEQYFYAWNNTTLGSCPAYPGAAWSAGTSTPVTSRTYTQAGNYYPCLRVTRGGGTEVDVRVHDGPYNGLITIGTVTPPSISISGPTSGQVNQSLTYSASASNCTPSPGGWSWSASGGGSISGSGSSRSITWATAGTKTVTASNSACGSATGQRSVSITSPAGGGGGGGGGTLAANFTFSPTSPQAGQQVSFNGSSSTGSPTGYIWTFGDGSTGSGVQVSHTFASPGTYSVKLEVTKQGDCPFGLCTAQTTKLVAVQGSSGPPPPPLAANFTFSPSSPQVGEAVSFDGSGSTGSPTAYDWSFGDGSTGSGAQVTHTFTAPGTYQVKLEVTGIGDCPFNFCTVETTKSVVVYDANACVPGNGRACLMNGRFQVEVDWQTNGETGPARVMAFNGSRAENQESAFMWFFSPKNFEMGVKMVDACTFNGKFWFFHSGLTNQGYTIRVRDMEAEIERTYQNPLGSFPTTTGDILAFDCEVSPLHGEASRSAAAAPPVVEQIQTSPAAVGTLRQSPGPCIPDAETACLLDGRFEVRVGWQTNDLTGTGRVMHFAGERAETDESVFMWFFGSQNFEMGIKMLDACHLDPFNSFWVFQSGLTNQGYTVSIRDSQTGLSRTYTNALGSFPTTTGDIDAFPCS